VRIQPCVALTRIADDEARRAALSEVVVPCSQALFGASELAVPARRV